jgi:Ca-activated chloride channel family protein
VAASLAQASAGHAGADAAAAAAADIGKDREGRGESPLSAPPSEQQLAQQQWLRSIPDDPGGLLRRKFLVEHLLRQQKSQP